MRMAERVDRNARGEVEVALAVDRYEPCALAPLEGEVDPRIGRQQMRCSKFTQSPLIWFLRQFGRNEMCRLSGRHRNDILLRRVCLSTRSRVRADITNAARSAHIRAMSGERCGRCGDPNGNMWM